MFNSNKKRIRVSKLFNTGGHQHKGKMTRKQSWKGRHSLDGDKQFSRRVNKTSLQIWEDFSYMKKIALTERRAQTGECPTASRPSAATTGNLNELSRISQNFSRK